MERFEHQTEIETNTGMYFTLDYIQWNLCVPTSCDFWQEIQVPKYFFNILC